MRRALAALAAAAFVGVAPAQDLPAEVRSALQAYDQFRSHVLWSWHPTQREVLVGRRADAGWLAHRVAGPGATPEPLAAPPMSSAACEPVRGEAFVYVGEDARIHRYDFATRVATPVSPEGEPATGFAWNRAGDRIVYGTQAPGATRTTLRIVDPGRPATERLLGRLVGRWSDPAFSDNGRRIALVQEVAGQSHLWIMDVATGTRRRVTRPDAKAPARWRAPRFSRDGRALFALGEGRGEHRMLFFVPLARGAPRPLTGRHKFDVDAFEPSVDAGLLAFLTNESGAHVMRFIDLATLEEQPRPPLFDGVIGGLAWRPGTRELGFHITSARSAGDVFSYDVKANQLTRWTNGNSPAVNTREFAEPRVVRWKSFDGREMTALLYRPPERFPGKRPVIVDHRTGPGGQARAEFLGRANYLVGELGVAILRPNVRGASGFGRAFRALGSGAAREDARKDIAALLEWIATEPGLDAGRALVLGDGVAGEPDAETFMRAAIDFARRVQR